MKGKKKNYEKVFMDGFMLQGVSSFTHKQWSAKKWAKDQVRRVAFTLHILGFAPVINVSLCMVLRMRSAQSLHKLTKESVNLSVTHVFVFGFGP